MYFIKWELKPLKKTIFDTIVAIKGAGDVASGVVCRLFKSNIFLMEVEEPVAIRRLVSFSEAVYKGETIIEGVTVTLATTNEDVPKNITTRETPVIVDLSWKMAKINFPNVLIDAIMVKKYWNQSY